MQEVIGWGLIGWKYYANVIGPIQCEGLASLGVMQVACAEKRFLILSRNGRVYTQAYNSDMLVGAECDMMHASFSGGPTVDATWCCGSGCGCLCIVYYSHSHVRWSQLWWVLTGIKNVTK